MEGPSAARSLPNILITGTPGSGKSSHCSALVAELNGSNGQPAVAMRHVEINDVAKANGLMNEMDKERGSYVLDEDKVCDALEDEMKAPGGAILATHSMVDYFPERWFDLVVVLKTDNTTLYDRLASRGYNDAKIQENVQAEIMMVLQEEARSSYDADIVQVLPSNTVAELESNVERIATWIRAWIADNQS
mmetsp:Transcript_14412/g.25810  ORF Transcript_14412/g.25810 Transcript_14412/m.25810 type:complete len:191 (-) Transcript_14412:52-624(-)|eukprot:CAMPEP_0184542524 /NCGR_PEP_ID=MMETSP0199_2-20130426/2139_1 /TAXON_ID=1112570 /ORGANISM="Thraustochytrium sp., Strain LLF1b" /LENGTH=190 /DNA_ID=CAMNT_0026936353 /DNA_START=26 /DNA_END=598 /DNA_ORIENTATION=-